MGIKTVTMLRCCAPLPLRVDNETEIVVDGF